MGSLFLVRHATTEASQAGVNLGKRTDAPLTPDGRRLAEQTGRSIAAELDGLPRGEISVVSSPAQRCRQTAEAIGGVLGVDTASIRVDDRLWEIDYGEWEGLSEAECRRRDPDLRRSWETNPYATATPGGESGAEVARRAFAAMAPIEDSLASDRGRVAVVVTHNHVVRLRLTALLGMPMSEYRRRIRADPGAYSLVTFSADGASIRRVNAQPAELATA
jgi:broad specificity phosphatase PhoE